MKTDGPCGSGGRAFRVLGLRGSAGGRAVRESAGINAYRVKGTPGARLGMIVLRGVGSVRGGAGYGGGVGGMGGCRRGDHKDERYGVRGDGGEMRGTWLKGARKEALRSRFGGAHALGYDARHKLGRGGEMRGLRDELE